MPKSNSDLIDQYIQTGSTGNWGVPQDASIGPMTKQAGINTAMSTPAFKRDIMLGGIGSYTEQLENLVKQGLIGKASNLFQEGHGTFLDKMGDIYDLGHIYNPGAAIHPEVLEHAGQAAGTPEQFNQALNNLNVMRTRSMPGGETGIEMAQRPSNAQMEQLMALFEHRPNAPVSLDLQNLQSQTGNKFSQYFPNPQHAIDAIYNFFK